MISPSCCLARKNENPAGVTTSLIISTYNWHEALYVCLKSVLEQSVLPDEILIADDGSKEDTRLVIQYFSTISPVPIIHVWHEDLGFRLSIIRNKAIALSSKDYIIQIDGDLILHRHFVKDHIAFARKNCFCSGSRALIKKKTTQKLLSQKRTDISIWHKGVKHSINAIRFTPLSPLLVNYRRKDASYSRGCNMAFWKVDLMTVNGYNESITGWGCEDHELVYRLINAGIRKRTIKFKAIVFHLFHRFQSRNNLDNNHLVLNNTIKQKLIWCDNGISQHQKE